ncbi:hypothetical protein IJH72_01110 [Candidatus Saccharibacteria bacterium]|nr:hypothetical protein [Candidatus Saccharibacteria bacterium]MBR0372529.1 hypothetical protein [Candidatus Saccharibacteria bacterium]
MKKRIIFYFITLMLFCQALPVSAVSKEQEAKIVEGCSGIQDNLKNLQRADAKARVYLGGYYETILSKFITPLNVRVVENNLSNAGLVENQNNFADTRTLFSNDFIAYQQELEDLVGIDCKSEPGDFYEQLVKVRKKRKVVEQDVLKMRGLISGHINLVNKLKGKL